MIAYCYGFCRICSKFGDVWQFFSRLCRGLMGDDNYVEYIEILRVRTLIEYDTIKETWQKKKERGGKLYRLIF